MSLIVAHGPVTGAGTNAHRPVSQPGPCATPTECLRWYALNAQCERSGNVWLQDDRRKWDGPTPLYVESEHDGHRYVSGRYGRLERRAAWCLDQLRSRAVPDVPVHMGHGLDLGDTQLDALTLSSTEAVSVITGGPGTGKTTIAQVLARSHRRVLGISPTGKGADRLGESIGATCYTIHRCARLVQEGKLSLDGYDLILCDETGMLDCPTLEMLCAKLHNSKTQARIVFLGDPGQLPSVGPGRVLDELIRSLPTTELRVVYRYSDADIGLACESARVGRLHDSGISTDSQALCYSIREGGFREAWGEYRRLLSIYGTQETRVITYHRRDADTFNQYAKQQIYRRPPIVCYRNNYEWGVFNGQCGYADTVGSHAIYFANKLYPSDCGIQWAYSYASTCHKAQGGQWDAVIVWIPSARYISKEWLLTALSRPVKALSVIVRDPETTERCLHGSKPASRRVSLLSGFLSGSATWIG